MANPQVKNRVTFQALVHAMPKTQLNPKTLEVSSILRI